MGRVTADRQATAQLGPPPDLSDLAGFPIHRTASDAVLYRAHDTAREPWWFARGGGRFDLRSPRGTCYLATSPAAAVRERLGPVLAARMGLPATVLDDVVVSRLRPGRRGSPGPVRLANLRVARVASFGVTRELESMTPYDVPAAWAAAFDALGLDGVRYGPRFSPGAASAIGLFGAEGHDRSRAVDPHPVPAWQVPGAPTPIALPELAQLHVIEPPRRGSARRR